ncbi:hypothetical protein PCK2_000197 [Pneumocystis canis]|nr:hypothetical protein PCK2_000197 [Pneumocystis canis]
MDYSYSFEAKDVLMHFGVNESQGLSSKEVFLARQKYGKNELKQNPKKQLWFLILEQFEDKLAIILLISAVISFVLALLEDRKNNTDFIDPLVILAILVLNAIVGIFQETNAEKAIAALQEYSPDEAKVIRNGRLYRIHAKDLVPGDIIDISIGDKIPADCLRNLSSVETLGSTSAICSDKTGTLTTNMMCVSKIIILEHDESILEFNVEGINFNPFGNVYLNDKTIIKSPASIYKSIKYLAEICSVCNDAKIVFDSNLNTYTRIGEPTEAALKSLVEKLGTDTENPKSIYNNSSYTDNANACNMYYNSLLPRLKTLEFSRDRKSMSVVVGNMESPRLLVKGAPETILERCNYAVIGKSGKKIMLTTNILSKINKKVTEYADIGIAMGSGTDVAKLTADMILSDDNFSTIEQAIEEGRAIYSNTQQFIRYLISSNIGEVISVFLTVLLDIPEVLKPVQLLWVNLVTDGLPATALSFNPLGHDSAYGFSLDTALSVVILDSEQYLVIFGGPQITFYELVRKYTFLTSF